LSLWLDSSGHLERVEFSPNCGSGKQDQIVDVTHTGIRNVQSPDPFSFDFSGGVERQLEVPGASLKPGAEKSAAVNGLEDNPGDSLPDDQGEWRADRGARWQWGMDDMLKRVSRERLEPFFRLQPQCQREHHSELGGTEHGRIFFELRMSTACWFMERFWASDAELQH